jgi:hypothetical protein
VTNKNYIRAKITVMLRTLPQIDKK